MSHSARERKSPCFPSEKEFASVRYRHARNFRGIASSVQTWSENRQRSVTYTWKRATLRVDTRAADKSLFSRRARAMQKALCENACAGFLAMCRPSCVCVMSRRGLLPNGSTCGGRRPGFSSSSPLLPRF